MIWSGGLRGYSASWTVAARDLAFFFPIVAVFFWFMRRQRFRGDMMLLTTAVFLFAFGQLMQYRLFSDPEYGARGAARAKAREAKAQTVRLLNIETGYDDEKKTFMFGSPAAVPRRPAVQTQPGRTLWATFSHPRTPTSHRMPSSSNCPPRFHALRTTCASVP